MPDARDAPVLLAVFGHPDDESLNLGGTLARYAAAGVRTVVVTCTGGEAGEDRSGSRAAGVLGDARLRELARALEVLGVSRSALLGYGDSGWPTTGAPGTFVAADLDAAAGRLARLIREERPEVVVTHDADGGYGHPDHVQTHRVARAAVLAAADPAHDPSSGSPWRVPRLASVVFPLSLVRKYVEGLKGAGIRGAATSLAGLDDPGETTPLPFGTPDARVDVALDVSAQVSTKRTALAVHRSQMPPEHPLMQLPDWLLREVWAREYFHLEQGSAADGGALLALRD